jgi:DNA-binding MltR family transcriptional regulator
MAGTNESVKKLRALLRHSDDMTEEENRHHIKQLAGKNDRLVAIVGGSIVEDTLQYLFEKKMPNKDAAAALFGPRGALASFSSKINTAYAFGFIDRDVQRNCDYIREIRNVFAHRIAPTSFTTPEVRDVCRLLVTMLKTKPARSMRQHYMNAVFATSLAIQLRTPARLSSP